WTKILAKKNSEEIFLSLLKLKYPERDTYIYTQNLENIKQERYFYIEDYYLSLKENTKILSIIKNYTLREENEKTNEHFIQNLNASCRIQLFNKGIETVSEIIRTIQSTEQMIEQLYKEQEPDSTDIIKPMYQTKDNNKEIRRKFWCKLHKTNTHSNEECLVQKNQIKTKASNSEHHKDQRSEKKINLIKDDFPYLKTYMFKIFPMYNKNIQMKAIIDSGSSKTYINENIAIKFRLKTKQISKNRVILADGSHKTFDKAINLEFSTANHKNYKIHANVIPNLSNDVILGVDFLTKYKFKIDFEKQMAESIHGSITLISEKTGIQSHTILDEEIDSRMQNNNIKPFVHENTRLKRIINRYLSKLTPLPI
ncbi:hypothetical protein H311_04239, partial [Anncaliia algerae PRA109]